MYLFGHVALSATIKVSDHFGYCHLCGVKGNFVSVSTIEFLSVRRVWLSCVELELSCIDNEGDSASKLWDYTRSYIPWGRPWVLRGRHRCTWVKKKAQVSGSIARLQVQRLIRMVPASLPHVSQRPCIKLMSPQIQIPCHPLPSRFGKTS